MLYAFLKITAGAALRIFSRRIIINKPELLKENGPLILACSHPNSFLDAMILDILFKPSIWSLTRGDAFKGKNVKKLLTSLKMLPVYRTSEGVENLSENYATFDACIELFKKNGVVLIFIEGLCENEWHLRPLKKGTARLAIRCQDEDIPLKVLPVGINYSSFTRFGKNIFINFGSLFSVKELDATAGEGIRIQNFNTRLKNELGPLVFEIEPSDYQKQKELLEINIPPVQKSLLAIPAFFGWLLHLPLYLPLKKIVKKKYGHTIHFDSVMFASLLFLYPIYLLLICFLLFYFTKSWLVCSLLLILPFTAWCYVQVKGQLDEP